MDDQRLKRAAVLQAKLQFLEEQKDSFTDREDILAFQRLRKQFHAVVSHHQDELTTNPVETIKRDLENEKALIDKLHHIDAEARLHNVALNTPGYLTPALIQKIIGWLAWRKESLKRELSAIQSSLSDECWDKNSGELLPNVKAITEFISRSEGSSTKVGVVEPGIPWDLLLAPDTKDFVAMASMKGPRYEALLGTLASIEELIGKKAIYVMHAGERLGPLPLDDLDKLLRERAVFAFDLAWHQAVGEWYPLFELAASLGRLGVLPVFDKSDRFAEAMLQQKLFYVARAQQICGPFVLNDLNLMIGDRMVSESELAWHSVAPDWQPLSQLIPILEEQKLLHLRKFTRIKRWIKEKSGTAFAK